MRWNAVLKTGIVSSKYDDIKYYENPVQDKQQSFGSINILLIRSHHKYIKIWSMIYLEIWYHQIHCGKYTVVV